MSYVLPPLPYGYDVSMNEEWWRIQTQPQTQTQTVCHNVWVAALRPLKWLDRLRNYSMHQLQCSWLNWVHTIDGERSRSSSCSWYNRFRKDLTVHQVTEFKAPRWLRVTPLLPLRFCVNVNWHDKQSDWWTESNDGCAVAKLFNALLTNSIDVVDNIYWLLPSV